MATTATVQMWGNTRAIRIPKPLARQIGLENGTKVKLSTSKGKLVLEPVASRPKYRLADLLKACKGQNPRHELITGRAGKELL